MPPRLNKRQQREQEELLSLAGPSKEAGWSEEEAAIPVKSGGTGFAALFTPIDDEPENSMDDGPAQGAKSRKSKKKKKRAPVRSANIGDEPEIAPSPGVPRNVSKQGRKVGKNKGKEKKDDKDDLDQALSELSIKYPELQNIAAATATTSSISHSISTTLASLLSVSLTHLDSEAEMRKFFGARVILANKSTNPSASSSRRPAATLRSNLTRPQPSWWAAKQREGLSIRPLTEEEIREKLERQPLNLIVGEKWWTVEYSKQYKSMTMAFIRTVMSGDPEGFWNLIQKLPWHADTLLQLAEVYRHREEYKQATDFVDRALFTYERSFIGAFNFTSGLNRLDFDRVENRPFFLALHRQIIDLQRRGCVRTAFEFARLLFSLDPVDPHGALLHLDYLAIKSGMGQWLLDVWDYFDERWNTEGMGFNRVNVTQMPGWAYARALALRATEGKDHTKSQVALEDAIHAFPSIVPLLADKLDVSFPSEIRGKKEFSIHTDASALGDGSLPILYLLSHLYVQRSSTLWKDPTLLSWFADTVKAVHVSVNSNLHQLRHRFLGFFSMPKHGYCIWRHIMVMESNYRNLFSFIPKTVLDARSLACDPLPPVTMVSMYDDEFFRGTDDLFAIRIGSRSRRDHVADQRLLERLVPDPVFRGQLQAFFEAHPQFARRFPGGIVQFAQDAGQLPEDILEAIIIAEVGAIHAGEGRGMPGEMPGQEILVGEDDIDHQGPPPVVQVESEDRAEGGEDLEDDSDDDDDDEEEEVAPLPVRFLRNMINRFWGVNRSESSEDEEADVYPRTPLDDGGVD